MSVLIQVGHRFLIYFLIHFSNTIAYLFQFELVISYQFTTITTSCFFFCLLRYT